MTARCRARTRTRNAARSARNKCTNGAAASPRGPLPLDEADERFPGHERKYANLPDAALPRTESLEDCIARMLPYWQMRIETALMAGRKPLVVAHGNSIRGIVKHLDDIPDDEIPGLEIPTGVPLVYDFDEALRPTGSRYLNRS
ncbi:2,3-bisphosphoglycerate-dependent phosphoglycerate mutase [Citreimonas salinaria]|uniref:2,3-bisphosphoglycerate-dependent phosphoglycerate mutase n=1 Tax=Citreimonas salinaria TaxID=321339 RepID=UPI003CCB776F